MSNTHDEIFTLREENARLKSELSYEVALRKVLQTYFEQHKDDHVLVRCENCDGLGFIPPLRATDAPTLQRWLHQSRERCHAQAHPTGIAPVLGRQASEYEASIEKTGEEINAYATKLRHAIAHPHLEIDVTNLSDAEKASILHAYDWSDEASDNALQRAGRRLMDESGKPREDTCKDTTPKGGESCCQ